MRAALFQVAKPQARKSENAFTGGAFGKRRLRVGHELQRQRLLEKLRGLAVRVAAECLFSGLVQEMKRA